VRIQRNMTRIRIEAARDEFSLKMRLLDAWASADRRAVDDWLDRWTRAEDARWKASRKAARSADREMGAARKARDTSAKPAKAPSREEIRRAAIRAGRIVRSHVERIAAPLYKLGPGKARALAESRARRGATLERDIMTSARAEALRERRIVRKGGPEALAEYRRKRNAKADAVADEARRTKMEAGAERHEKTRESLRLRAEAATRKFEEDDRKRRRALFDEQMDYEAGTTERAFKAGKYDIAEQGLRKQLELLHANYDVIGDHAKVMAAVQRLHASLLVVEKERHGEVERIADKTRKMLEDLIKKRDELAKLIKAPNLDTKDAHEELDALMVKALALREALGMKVGAGEKAQKRVKQAEGHARGGWVGGRGGTDTVPAWLTPGERVMNPAESKVWGPLVDALGSKGPGGMGDTNISATFNIDKMTQPGDLRKFVDELKWLQRQDGMTMQRR